MTFSLGVVHQVEEGCRGGLCSDAVMDVPHRCCRRRISSYLSLQLHTPHVSLTFACTPPVNINLCLLRTAFSAGYKMARQTYHAQSAILVSQAATATRRPVAAYLVSCLLCRIIDGAVYATLSFGYTDCSTSNRPCKPTHTHI